MTSRSHSEEEKSVGEIASHVSSPQQIPEKKSAMKILSKKPLNVNFAISFLDTLYSSRQFVNEVGILWQEISTMNSSSEGIPKKALPAPTPKGDASTELTASLSTPRISAKKTKEFSHPIMIRFGFSFVFFSLTFFPVETNVATRWAIFGRTKKE